MHIIFSLATLTLLVISSSSSIFTDAFSSVTLRPSVHRHVVPGQEYLTTSSPRQLLLPLYVFFSRNGDNGDDYFNDDDADDDDGDRFDVEKARERLEALLVGGPDNNEEPDFSLDNNHPKMRTVERRTIRSPSYSQSPLPALDVVLPPAPPLTTFERERREVEIELLSRLTDGDESVSDLWTLWFGERGGDSAQRLLQAEELTGDGPPSWGQAEDILRDLIQEHGVYWVEPVNRLATLFYMQGRLDEAETLCKIVLAVKPWHFGALSAIVMIYAAQADSDKARLWASSRLPTFAPTGANRRRTAWAEKAVESAKESLENAEKRVHEFFGAPDDYCVKADKTNIQITELLGENDGEAWQ